MELCNWDLFSTKKIVIDKDDIPPSLKKSAFCLKTSYSMNKYMQESSRRQLSSPKFQHFPFLPKTYWLT